MTQVKIRIDLATGVVDIEAPVEEYVEVLAQVREALPGLVKARGGSTTTEAPSTRDAEDSSKKGSSNSKSKRTRRSSGSAKETYNVAKLGLDEDERQALRDFYVEKNPGAQHDQIAVLMYWFQSHTNRQQMSKDEIFTAFRTVEAKVPAKISSVLGNMTSQLQWATAEGSGNFKLTHVGEDHVKYSLPKESKG